jgi:hypothetical protein
VANAHLILCRIAYAFLHLHSHRIIFCTFSRFDIRMNSNNEPVLGGFQNAVLWSPNVRGPEIIDEEFQPYCAPEILSRTEITPFVDVWSFGVVLFELVSRTAITKESAEQFRRGVRFELPDPRYLTLAQQCLASNPNKRPPFGWICHFLTDKTVFQECETIASSLEPFSRPHKDVLPTKIPLFL